MARFRHVSRLKSLASRLEVGQVAFKSLGSRFKSLESRFKSLGSRFKSLGSRFKSRGNRFKSLEPIDLHVWLDLHLN